MPIDPQKLTDRIFKTLTRNRDLDPLTLAEKVSERVTDYLEDCGIVEGVGLAGSVDEAREQIREYGDPRRVLDRLESTATGRRSRLEPFPTERRREPSPAPPQPAGKLIALPGDPEFERAESLRREEAEPARVSTGARVSKIGATAETTSETAYWTTEGLIKYLEQKFPPRVRFTPDGMEETVRIEAVRNIQAQINTYGANGVRITYAHEGVSQDGMDDLNPVGEGLAKVNIAPIASHLFSCAEQTIDVEGVLSKLGDQLCGLYAPRRKNMEPGYIGEPPIDSWNAGNPGMKDSDSIRGSNGWKSVDNPLGRTLDNVYELNRKVGTPGATPR